MKFAPLASFLFAAILFLGVPAHAERKLSITAFATRGLVKVTVSLPQDWKGTATSFIPDAPPYANLQAPSGATLRVSLDAPLESPATISRRDAYVFLKKWGDNYLAHSMENKVTLVKMESKNGFGAYATFTNANPAGVKAGPEGKFRHWVAGIFVIRGTRVYFQLYVNDLKDSAFEETLKIIQEKTVVR